MRIHNLLLSMMFVGSCGSGNVLADSEQETAIQKGREHYKIFCTNCHGVNADGKGPLVAHLKITPSDLTALNQTGDECMAERVLKALSGRHQVGGGQDQKMPVFSDNLAVITVYEISEYLKTVQK